MAPGPEEVNWPALWLNYRQKAWRAWYTKPVRALLTGCWWAVPAAEIRPAPALRVPPTHRAPRPLPPAPQLLCLLVLVPVGVFAGGLTQIDFLLCPSKECRDDATQELFATALACPTGSTTVGEE